eukprot:355302-Chlamydomonas_euryale.AAC.3
MLRRATQVTELTEQLRTRGVRLAELEAKASAAEAAGKLALAEAQAMALTENTGMKAEVDDMKAALARVQRQYEEAVAGHTKVRDWRGTP